MPASAIATPTIPFVLTETGLVWTGDGETLRIDIWGESSARVRSTLSGEIEDTDWALLPQDGGADGTEHPAAAPTIEIEATPGTWKNTWTATLHHGDLTVVARAEEFGDAQAGYERASCHLAFYRGQELILEEDEVRGAPLKRRAREYLPFGAHHRVSVSFSSSPAEKLVGMGLYQQENLDLKGTTLELAHRNSQASVPFVVSSAGYGFLWHNPAIGRATFATNRTEWVAESAGQLDYWVTVGFSPAQILEHYATATGTVPVMPEYGLGYWQCKLRYANQEELLEVAREHARRQIPLDLIVIDFFHWPHMGDYRYEDEFWPDPEAMVAELAELGVKLMVSVWPQVSLDSENFTELMRKNYLVRSDQGLDVQMYFQGPSRFLDVTHPDAREWLWQRLQKNYPGTVSFWLDEAEPEYGLYQYPQYRYHAGHALEVSNIYPQLFSRAVFDGQVRDQPSADGTGPINLVRCAWAGSQRYGALVWSGDIHSSFEAMRRQVVAGVHMGMTGLPWFTTDIGGFAGGDVTSPDFRELLVRWFQMATFMPVMRMHGDRLPSHEVSAADGTERNPAGAANEVWSYGEQIEQILVRFIHAREDLRPYTRRVMAEAHETGHAVMRGLFHDFPEDLHAWEVTDQFLFGPDLLVAPVVELGSRERRVYLPAGARWIDVATGQVHEGGSTVTLAAPLESIPVLVREGTDGADGALDALRKRIGTVGRPRP